MDDKASAEAERKEDDEAEPDTPNKAPENKEAVVLVKEEESTENQGTFFFFWLNTCNCSILLLRFLCMISATSNNQK